MRISKRFAFILMGAVITFTGLSIPVSTQAQYVLRNQNRLSYAQIGQIITRLENSSDRFRGAFDQQMDRNRRNDDQGFVDAVNKFEGGVDELRREYSRTRNWWELRNSVANVVNDGQSVNSLMNTLSFRRNLEQQWSALRNDINTLADTFDTPGLNGGGWQGGNNNGNWNNGNGNWNGGRNMRPMRPPTWAVGTFYSRRGADDIQLTINADGTVFVVNNGQTFNGVYTRGGMLWVNNDSSTITQTRNGIRTYNTTERVTTTYTRNRGNMGNGGGWGNNNQTGGWNNNNTGSRPPSWAIGTFVNNANPDFSMTIDDSGRVTVYTGGQTFYGTYNGQNNTLFLNGDSSTVEQSGRGIRTYNSNTGQTTNYRRR